MSPEPQTTDEARPETAATPPTRTCTAKTAAGRPCRSTAVNAEGRCPAHTEDAGVALAVTAARKRGGQRRQALAHVRVYGVVLPEDVDFSQPRQLLDVLALTAKAAAAGSITAATASAISALVGQARTIVADELERDAARLHEAWTAIEEHQPRRR
jgi:hypothetical protein